MQKDAKSRVHLINLQDSVVVRDILKSRCLENLRDTAGVGKSDSFLLDLNRLSFEMRRIFEACIEGMLDYSNQPCQRFSFPGRIFDFRIKKVDGKYEFRVFTPAELKAYTDRANAASVAKLMRRRGRKATSRNGFVVPQQLRDRAHGGNDSQGGSAK